MASDTNKTHSFKVTNKFLVKSGCKKRVWRSLKQILAADRVLPWPSDSVLYYSINAPPTFKPVKKYSDISGLPALYMDRHSKLFYSNADEFATVRSLPMDITAGYLQLRGANTISFRNTCFSNQSYNKNPQDSYHALARGCSFRNPDNKVIALTDWSMLVCIKGPTKLESANQAHGNQARVTTAWQHRQAGTAATLLSTTPTLRSHHHLSQILILAGVF